MQTWIALLRGINVGGHHKLPMKSLVRLMEDAGYAEVRTYIQSGNAVFRSASAPDDSLGRLVEASFGFRPSILFMTANDLAMAATNSPFSPKEGKHLHFFFCEPAPASLDTALLDAVKAPSEAYRLVGKVFYLHAPDGIARSKLAARLGKALPGIDMTARNLNTVKKLLELAERS